MSEGEIAEQLRRSREAVGPLYPILTDMHGNIIDGYHRHQVDPNWPSIVVPWVRTREDQLVARIVANTCRRTVSKEERKRELTELATLMLNRGVPKGQIVDEISEKTGLSRQYIRSLLPRAFKVEVKVKAALEKGKKKPPIQERRENLLFSEEQILAPIRERAEIQPPPKPDLGVVSKPGDFARVVEEASRYAQPLSPAELERWHAPEFIELAKICVAIPEDASAREAMIRFEKLVCDFIRENNLADQLKEWVKAHA